MRMHRRFALGAALLALVVSACAPGDGGQSQAQGGSQPAGESQTADKPTLTVGSAGFYESALMAEIYAQALEAHGYTVERQLEIGTREQTKPAIESGEIDLLPEYIGSALSFLGRDLTGDEAVPFTASGDPDETYAKLETALADLDLAILDYTPAQDQNAFVVRQETADEFGLETMSDLTDVAAEFTWGLPPECETNPLCSGALEEYGIPYADLEIEPLAACDAPVAIALNEGAIDVAELCSTQPDIERFNFVLLEDDLQTQPAENIAPVVRQEFLDSAPADFAEILNAVSAEMTTEELTSLGVKIAVDQEDRADVARQWLENNGLL